MQIDLGSTAPFSGTSAGGSTRPGRPRTHRLVAAPLRTSVVVAIVYLLTAYLFIPFGWGHYERRHPALSDVPRITHTRVHIPGDPLNVAFIGTEEDLHLALLAAKWFPADPITLKSSLKIAAGTLFHKSYVDAPVSNLFLWKRKQDLAFEQPAGKDPRRRHHVRFWRCEKLDDKGIPLWIGSATFDAKVGLSRRTGQITHHIDANIDAERDKILDDVRRTGDLSEAYWIDRFQEKLQGKNGGGDRYHTDGRLAVGVLSLRRDSAETP